MNISTVCLGILSRGDATGYDIKRNFEQTYRHFFVAGYGSIYPALARLAQEGLVTMRQEPGRGGRYRKVYSLTADGRAALKSRLAETEPAHRVHSDFMLLMFFADQLEPSRVEELISARLDEIQRYIVLLQGLNANASHDEPGRAFTRGLGLTVLHATQKYLEQSRDDFVRVLRQMADAKDPIFKPTLRGETP